MPCFRPVTCWKDPDGGPISFFERKDFREISIPCGKCIGCRIMVRDGWAFRAYAESQMHDENCFLTLTYSPENVPLDNSVDHRHWQLFAKRLRKGVGSFRFFMCGEYGEQFSRPHYHALLFGYRPDDMRQSNSMYSKYALFESEYLSRLWGKGFVSVGEVTMQSARYCASYVTKRMSEENWKRSELAYHVDQYGEIHERRQPYCKMSLKPGLGSSWLAAYRSDIYNNDSVVLHGGQRVKVPRYFDDLMAEFDCDELEASKLRRTKLAERFIENNSRARLEVREKCAEAKLKHTREVKGYAL